MKFDHYHKEVHEEHKKSYQEDDAVISHAINQRLERLFDRFQVSRMLVQMLTVLQRHKMTQPATVITWTTAKETIE